MFLVDDRKEIRIKKFVFLYLLIFYVLVIYYNVLKKHIYAPNFFHTFTKIIPILI